MSDYSSLIVDAWYSSTKSSNGFYRANCPVCDLNGLSVDKNQSLGIHVTGGWHCFRCSQSGYVKDLPADTIVKSFKAEEEESSAIELPEEFKPLWEEPFLSAFSTNRFRKYLEGRGFFKDTWFKAKIGACLDGRYGDRVIVPVMNSELTETVGFVARLCREPTDFEKKTLYPKGMKTGSVLYDEYLLTIDTDKPLLIVEGVMDALSFHGQACALFGKPSKAQKEKLILARRPIAICLDADAEKDSWALMAFLKFYNKKVGIINLPSGEDPNTVDKSVVYEQLNSLF